MEGPSVLKFMRHVGSESCLLARGVSRYGEETRCACCIKKELWSQQSHKPAFSECQRVNELSSYLCSESLSFYPFCSLLEYCWGLSMHRRSPEKVHGKLSASPRRQVLGSVAVPTSHGPSAPQRLRLLRNTGQSYHFTSEETVTQGVEGTWPNARGHRTSQLVSSKDGLQHSSRHWGTKG